MPKIVVHQHFNFYNLCIWYCPSHILLNFNESLITRLDIKLYKLLYIYINYIFPEFWILNIFKHIKLTFNEILSILTLITFLNLNFHNIFFLIENSRYFTLIITLAYFLKLSYNTKEILFFQLTNIFVFTNIYFI